MKRAVRAARSRLRTAYERLRRFYEPWRRRVQGTLTREQLAAALTDAGVVPGATVMTHVSMDEIMRTTSGVGALDLIALLKELLTEDGTLLVPTFPFTGFEADYLATNPGFDVRRTPSQTGLMTELFRRMPDTTRSLHPTHPVSGWGAHATELLSTHHLGETFGELSPFCRMREHNGVVIGIGSLAFTIIHSGEYLNPKGRAYAFAPETHTTRIKDRDRTIDYTFYPLRRRVIKHRAGASKLRKEGVLRCKRYRGLLVASVLADAIIDRCFRAIDEGSFYDLRRSAH